MQPTIIIEIQNGKLESVYSNTNINLFLVDRDLQEAGGPPITGPFVPTLVQDDLVKAVNDPAVNAALLAQPPGPPYF